MCGCATSVDRRPLGPAGGGQGESWEVILPAPLLAEEPGADELSRRDFALSERYEAPRTAADDWPAPARPDLQRPWRLWFSTSDREYLFFRPERPRHTWWWGW